MFSNPYFRSFLGSANLATPIATIPAASQPPAGTRQPVPALVLTKTLNVSPIPELENEDGTMRNDKSQTTTKRQLGISTLYLEESAKRQGDSRASTIRYEESQPLTVRVNEYSEVHCSAEMKRTPLACLENVPEEVYYGRTKGTPDFSRKEEEDSQLILEEDISSKEEEDFSAGIDCPKLMSGLKSERGSDDDQDLDKKVKELQMKILEHIPEDMLFYDENDSPRFKLEVIKSLFSGELNDHMQIPEELKAEIESS